MSWSAAFLEALDAKIAAPVYLLSVVECSGAPYTGDLVIASADVGVGSILLGLEPPSITGPRVTPVSWSTTIGQWSVVLAGELDEAVQRLTRGSVVALRMGFSGWDPALFEVVAVGMVWSVSGSHPRWELTCTDMLAMLQSRLATASSAYLPLFFAVTATTTISGTAYTAGDTTAYVASTSSFERETGGSYGIKITPSSGNPAFYLTCTGTSGAPAFTGATTSSLGFTVSNAAIGSTVAEIAYLEGHPLDIVRRLLCSTGGGGNGAWDDYPVSWGWGIPLYLVDVDDIEGWKTNIVKVASGSYLWQLLIEEPIDAPGTWLQSLLAGAGMFLTIRQGILTCRAAQLHVSVTADPFDGDLEITEADILSATIDLHDPTVATEYATITAATSTGTTTTSADAIQTLPATEEVIYDVSDRVYQNESAVRTEMTGRLTESSTRIPEAVRLTLRGLWWSQLAPGSVPRLTCSWLRGRLDNTRGGYDGRRVLVVQVGADHRAWTTSVTVLAYPTDDRMFA